MADSDSEPEVLPNEVPEEDPVESDQGLPEAPEEPEDPVEQPESPEEESDHEPVQPAAPEENKTESVDVQVEVQDVSSESGKKDEKEDEKTTGVLMSFPFLGMLLLSILVFWLIWNGTARDHIGDAVTQGSSAVRIRISDYVDTLMEQQTFITSLEVALVSSGDIVAPEVSTGTFLDLNNTLRLVAKQYFSYDKFRGYQATRAIHFCFFPNTTYTPSYPSYVGAFYDPTDSDQVLMRVISGINGATMDQYTVTKSCVESACDPSTGTSQSLSYTADDLIFTPFYQQGLSANNFSQEWDGVYDLAFSTTGETGYTVTKGLFYEGIRIGAVAVDISTDIYEEIFNHVAISSGGLAWITSKYSGEYTVLASDADIVDPDYCNTENSADLAACQATRLALTDAAHDYLLTEGIYAVLDYNFSYVPEEAITLSTGDDVYISASIIDYPVFQEDPDNPIMPATAMYSCTLFLVSDTQHSNNVRTTYALGMLLIVALVLGLLVFWSWKISTRDSRRETIKWFFSILFSSSYKRSEVKRLAKKSQMEELKKNKERAEFKLEVATEVVKHAEKELTIAKSRALDKEHIRQLQRAATIKSISAEEGDSKSIRSEELVKLEKMASMVVKLRHFEENQAPSMSRASSSELEEKKIIDQAEDIYAQALKMYSRAKRVFDKRLAAYTESLWTYKKHGYYVNAIGGMLPGTFLFMLILMYAFLFTSVLSGASDVDHVLNLYSDDNADSVISSIKYVLDTPSLLLHELTDRWERGDFVPENRSTGVTFDPYFTDLLSTFQNNINELNYDSFIYDLIYVGIDPSKSDYFFNDTGWDYISFLGAGVFDDGTGGFYRGFQATDSASETAGNETSVCRDQYQVQMSTRERIFPKIADNSNCCYYPEQRPWYIKAVDQDNRLSVWTDPYAYTDGSVGVTAAKPFFTPDTDELVGVFAVDLRLTQLQTTLVDAQAKTFASRQDNSSILIVVSRSGRYISGTEADSFTNDEKKSGLAFCWDHEDEIIRATCEYIFQNGLEDSGLRVDGFELSNNDTIFKNSGCTVSDEWDGDACEITRDYDAPPTYVGSLNVDHEESQGLDWLVILIVAESEVTDEIEASRTLNFLMKASAIVFFCGVLGSMLSQSGDVSSNSQAVLEEQEERDEFIKDHGLNLLISRETITRTVRYCFGSYLKYSNVHTKQHREDLIIERATSHFLEPNNIMTTLSLQQGTLSELLANNTERNEEMKELVNQDEQKITSDQVIQAHNITLASTMMKLYKVKNSGMWGLLMFAIVVLHCLYGFAEPPFKDQIDLGNLKNVCAVQDCNQYWFSILPILVVCLLFETIDLFMQWSIIFFAGKNHLMSKAYKLIASGYAFIVLLCWIDFIFLTTGPRTNLALLAVRPLLWLCVDERVRATASTFVKTMFSQSMRIVFYLYFAIVVIAAALGTVLFREIINVGQLSSSYTNFVRSLTTSFVFISTGENYTDVVYPSTAESPFYVIYFIIFTLVGMFVILAMVIDRFQDGFEQYYEKQKMKQMLLEESKYIAAYALLTIDLASVDELVKKIGSDRRVSALTFATDSEDPSDFLLQEKMFRRFMNRVHNILDESAFDMEPDPEKKKRLQTDALVKRQLIGELFKSLDEGDKGEDFGLTEDEFVKGIPKFKLFDSSKSKQDFEERCQESEVRQFLRKYLLQREGSWIAQLVVFFEVVLMVFYGTARNHGALDMALFFLLLVQVIEMGVKIYVWGWDRFWNHDNHVSRNVLYYRQAQNRVDFILISLSLVSSLIARLLSAESGFLQFADDEDAYRFCLTFPILRAFTLIESLRILIFSMTSVVPQFLSLFLLLLVFFYVYGVAGIYLFSDKYYVITSDFRTDANFDTLGQAFVTLFQLLVGEGWHEVMYEAIMATAWSSSFYFITYTIMVALFFGNLFIGLILNSQKEAYDATQEKLQELKEKSEAEERKKQLEQLPSE